MINNKRISRGLLDWGQDARIVEPAALFRPDDTAGLLPALFDHYSPLGGLLAMPDTPPISPLLANVNPVYDTQYILRMMENERREERKRLAPDIQMLDIQDQHAIDNKNIPEPDFPPLPRFRRQ